MQRDNKWLENKLFDIWEDHFSDIPRKNLVLIKFGKKAKRQLGCIKWAHKKTRGISKLVERYGDIDQDDKRVSVIIITKYFQNLDIPEDIIDATIIHELCHYSHGFNSPLNQIFDHPHQGGIIRKEFEKRGLGKLHKFSKKWIKENWIKIIRH